MNLRHLRCFVAVGEELHFGRAARRLHVEQSPLSRTIRQLEADLGVTLLERMPRSVCLTPAGQVFLEEARRVLLTLEQARTKARAVAAGLQGTLRIALTGCAGQVRLPALLALCREEAPSGFMSMAARSTCANPSTACTRSRDRRSGGIWPGTGWRADRRSPQVSAGTPKNTRESARSGKKKPQPRTVGVLLLVAEQGTEPASAYEVR